MHETRQPINTSKLCEKKPAKEQNFKLWYKTMIPHYLKYHYSSGKHSQHTTSAQIHQPTSLYVKRLSMVSLGFFHLYNIFALPIDPSPQPFKATWFLLSPIFCPSFKGQICLHRHKISVCEKYAEILLSSWEEDHVGLYMAMKIGKQNQNNMF